MKKILLLIFLFFLLSVSVNSSDNYGYFLSDDSYNLYSVSIDNLNTKNFLSYFDGINVIRLYPKVNPIYKNIMRDISYKFSGDNISHEINSFNNYYLSLIKKNSYSDYNYLYINGIPIDKVSIYISESELYNFLNKTGGYIN